MKDSVSAAKHLTVEDARKILGEEHKDRTDEEIEQCLQHSRSVARLLVDLFLKEAKEGKLEHLKVENQKSEEVEDEKKEGD